MTGDPLLALAAASAVLGVAAGWLLGYMHGQMTARWVWRVAARKIRN